MIKRSISRLFIVMIMVLACAAFAASNRFELGEYCLGNNFCTSGYCKGFIGGYEPIDGNCACASPNQPNQCDANSYCALRGDTFCTPKKDSCATCGANYQCLSNLCHNGKCRDDVSIVCPGEGTKKLQGLTCNLIDSLCESNYCIPGSDPYEPERGSKCACSEPNSIDGCPSGKYCVSRNDIACTLKKAQCSTCNHNNQCQSSLCHNSKCRPDVDFVCPGEAAEDTTSICDPNNYKYSGFMIGGICNGNNECKSRKCDSDSQICICSSSIGMQYNQGCSGEMYCANDKDIVCTQKKTNCEICTHGCECASNICHNGKCRESETSQCAGEQQVVFGQAGIMGVLEEDDLSGLEQADYVRDDIIFLTGIDLEIKILHNKIQRLNKEIRLGTKTAGTSCSNNNECESGVCEGWIWRTCGVVAQ